MSNMLLAVQYKCQNLVVSTKSIWASSPILTEGKPVNLQRSITLKRKEGGGGTKNSFHPLLPYPLLCISHLHSSRGMFIVFSLARYTQRSIPEGKEWASSYLQVAMEMGPIYPP